VSVETITVDGEIRTVGRPDFNGYGMEWARTKAKRHAKYVYSRRFGILLHEVREAELSWWKLGNGGKYWVRRQSPRITYLTKCGTYFFGPDPEAETPRGRKSRALVCELPKADAVLCGRCRGEGPVFGKGMQRKDGGPTRQEARARLGCAVAVEAGNE